MSQSEPTVPTVAESPAEIAAEEQRLKRRGYRNYAILAALVAWVVVIYFVSIIRMSGA